MSDPGPQWNVGHGLQWNGGPRFTVKWRTDCGGTYLTRWHRNQKVKGLNFFLYLTESLIINKSWKVSDFRFGYFRIEEMFPTFFISLTEKYGFPNNSEKLGYYRLTQVVLGVMGVVQADTNIILHGDTSILLQSDTSSSLGWQWYY